MWFQVFLGEWPDATPTTKPLKELDLLLEIKRLSKLGIKWEEMSVAAFEITAREIYELRDLW